MRPARSLQIDGVPSPDEAAAIAAAVQVLLDAAPGDAPALPWPYRSAWRRAAIDEGVDRLDVS